MRATVAKRIRKSVNDRMGGRIFYSKYTKAPSGAIVSMGSRLFYLEAKDEYKKMRR